MFGGLFGVKLLYISRAAGRCHYSKMTSLNEDITLKMECFVLSLLVLNFFILVGLRYAITYDGMLHMIVLKLLDKCLNVTIVDTLDELAYSLNIFST